MSIEVAFVALAHGFASLTSSELRYEDVARFQRVSKANPIRGVNGSRSLGAKFEDASHECCWFLRSVVIKIHARRFSSGQGATMVVA